VAADRSGGRPRPPSFRLRLLLLALVVALVALVAFYRFWSNRIPPPPPRATSDQLKAYYAQRIHNDLSDVEAVTELGLLEEKTGYFNAARRHLGVARALKGDEVKITGALGRAWVQLGRLEEARPELERAVALQPDRAEAVANLAGYYVRQGELAPAATVLKTFLERHPNLPIAEQERLCYALLECDDTTQALASAVQILQKQPTSLIANLIAGRCSLATKQFADAERYLRAGIAQEPKNAALHYLCGLALFGQAREDEAIALWKKAVAINPRADDAYERLAESYAKRGDWKRAAEAILPVAQRNQQLESVVHRAAVALEKAGRPAEALFWRALDAGLLGNYPQAEALGRQLMAHPDPAAQRQGLDILSEAYRAQLKKKEYREAILRLTQKETVDDLLVRAQAHELLDELPLKVACLKKALTLGSEKAGYLHALLGETAKQRGLRSEAESEYEQAVAASPNSAKYAYALGSLYFDRRSQPGYLEKAVASYRRALSLDPESADAWLGLGLALVAQDKLNEASFCIEHTIDLEPGHGPAYLELGRLYSRQNRKSESEEALRLYKRFVTYDQQEQTLRTRARAPQASAKAMEEYADFLLRDEALGEANRWYSRAAALAPQNQALQQKLRTLSVRLGAPEGLP